MESFTGEVTLYRSLKAREGKVFQRKGTAELKARRLESEQLV